VYCLALYAEAPAFKERMDTGLNCLRRGFDSLTLADG
jgi:hypothetical protein